MKTIELYCGFTREQTYPFLQKKAQELGEAVQANFNGNWVNSYMTEDQIYLTITGHTKAYLDEKDRIEKEKIEAFKQKIPELCEDVMNTVLANGLVKKSMIKEFKKQIPYRFDDCYQGKDVYDMISINKILIDNKDNLQKAIDLAKEEFENQGHSNRSAYTTALMVFNFCPVFGKEFYEKAFLDK